MITTVIFSKDRACQLDLLLRSIQLNLPGFNLSDIKVLYKASDPFFESGYSLLKNKFPTVFFCAQTDFQTDLTSILIGAYGCVCFFVDDNIIYRYCPIRYEVINEILHNVEYNICCLTLRLGENVVMQDIYAKVPTVFPPVLNGGESEGLEFIVWDRTTVPRFSNFGYAFSVDGHMYKTQSILDGLHEKFVNPNEFESGININIFEKNMICLKHSIVVNTPINAVAPYNASGRQYPLDIETLNNEFLSGKILKYELEEIVGCHQELKMSFME